MQKIFAPSLLRALVSRNVLVSVLALVVVVGVAIYESNGLILGQFADESAILADVAQNEIFDQADLAQRAASLFATLPTTRDLLEARDRDALTNFLLPLKARIGEIQQLTPMIEALYVPDIDTSLDEEDAKREFWAAFRVLGEWYASQPPY